MAKLRLDVVACVVIGAGALVSMFAREELAALVAPTPKTLLVAVELGTGARRSIATYATEGECSAMERSLNRVAEENGRTERSVCAVPAELNP